MYSYYFVFQSLTSAQSAMALLQRMGFHVMISRAPSSYVQQGCSHAVLVPVIEGQAAAGTLRQNRIVFRHVVMVMPNGSVREVAL